MVVRTPEDDERLEERLEKLKFVTTPKLETLRSCSFLPHLEESLEKNTFSLPSGHQEDRIIELM